jgi:hypothetical protein
MNYELIKEKKMSRLPLSPVEALVLVAKTKFRPFDEADWMSFSGCESENPFIGEVDDIAVVLDGDVIFFQFFGEADGEPDWATFKLNFEVAY